MLRAIGSALARNAAELGLIFDTSHLELLTHELAQTTIIHIGRTTQAHLPLFKQVLHLKRLDSEADKEEDWAKRRVWRRRR